MNAVYLSLGVLVVGIVLAVATKRLGVGDSATFIALLIIPLLVYGVASGKIQEFTGPGGWGAKFREAAQAQVTPVATAGLTNAIQNLELIGKEGLDALPAIQANLPKDKPIALTFQLGPHGYNTDVAIQYAQALLIVDSEMTVVILDPDRHFVAMTEGTTFLRLLQAPGLGQRVLTALNGGDRNFLLALPGLHTNTIKTSDNNATALELMRLQNARAIVVVDADNRPVGIVKRDDIVARLLEKLAIPDKS
jgi:CBS domain-containing protein